MIEGERVSAGGRHDADRALPRWASPLVILLGLYLLSLAIDLIFGLRLHFKRSQYALEADEREYFEMASALMAGQLEMTARRTLGFPLLLAGIRAAATNFLLLQMAVTALYSLAAPLLAVVARRMTGSWLYGGACGLALALWPPAIFYGTSLYSETVALPAFLAALALLPPGSRLVPPARPGAWWQALLCGAVLGATTHIRPMYLLFTPVLALIVLCEEARLARAIGRVALVAAGFLAVILPWSIYMTTTFGHPILVTSNGGETLSGGLNPKLLEPQGRREVAVGDRIVWVGPGKWLPPEQNGFLAPAEYALPYDRKDALLRERTLAWAEAHPGDAAFIEGSKLTYLWGVWPLTGNGINQFLFGNLPTLALLLVCLFCFWRLPLARARLARFWLIGLFVSGVALISWGSWRFRQPADAGLLAFAAICLLDLRGRRGYAPGAASAR